MIDHEHALLAYLRLADIARRKRQQSGRNKFLLLAGAAALRAGWPDVAERCRAAVLETAPRHLIGQHDSFASAMRADDFQPFLRRLERFCPFEQAEALLAGLDADDAPPASNDEETVGDIARRLLESNDN